jgi:hypothetical protein
LYWACAWGTHCPLLRVLIWPFNRRPCNAAVWPRQEE